MCVRYVEEPAIVARSRMAEREVQQCFFKSARRVPRPDALEGFVEQQTSGALFQRSKP